MQQELSCDQVGALMTFYIEDKLSAKLTQYVQRHLDICPTCREKYDNLKQMVNKFINIKKDIEYKENDEFENPFLTRQYEEFKINLSAYIDNELNDSDNIKIKKISISNPLARRDLEDMYTFKKLLHTSFDKTRNDSKSDFSKLIISQVQSNGEKRQIDPFTKVVIAFFTMMSCIVVGIIGVLYF